MTEMAETVPGDEVDIAANLESVRRRIAAAAEAVGRDPGGIELVAVSKKHPVARVEAAIAAGHRGFGENRVQEAQGKYPDLKARVPDLRLHLVGPLQTNKVKDAVALFDVIQSLDRPRLAESLAKALAPTREVTGAREGAARVPELFVQINTGEEPQKAGIAPGEADAFIAYCRDELALPLAGLMCIPPLDEEPAPHFALLAKLAARNGLSGLSMGMSGDFETAVKLGATCVRVGESIFGPRPKDG